MKLFEKYLQPNRTGFKADPFGYSALGWKKWVLVREVAGIPVDFEQGPSHQDLKSPVLWLSQAYAMSQAAKIVLRAEPNLEPMPINVRGICDSQYCAIGLMLIGYSLEIALKAMILIEKGIDQYVADEKQHKHHRLEELADFVPALDAKDKAILTLLSSFITWAGRYPDPGSGRETDLEAIFSISEKHRISSANLFALASKVMSHANHVGGADAP